MPTSYRNKQHHLQNFPLRVQGEGREVLDVSLSECDEVAVVLVREVVTVGELVTALVHRDASSVLGVSDCLEN